MKRKLSILLAMVLVFSLFSGIAVYAASAAQSEAKIIVDYLVPRHENLTKDLSEADSEKFYDLMSAAGARIDVGDADGALPLLKQALDIVGLKLEDGKVVAKPAPPPAPEKPPEEKPADKPADTGGANVPSTGGGDSATLPLLGLGLSVSVLGLYFLVNRKRVGKNAE